MGNGLLAHGKGYLDEKEESEMIFAVDADDTSADTGPGRTIAAGSDIAGVAVVPLEACTS